MALWKRSISFLYGALASPMTIPVTKTARKPAHEPQQQPARGRADRSADRHLPDELHQSVDRRVPAAESGGADQCGHERDTDRVVGAGLAFEDHAGAADDIPAAQDGEDDGRVGG
jgi:hypothetical protein